MTLIDMSHQNPSENPLCCTLVQHKGFSPSHARSTSFQHRIRESSGEWISKCPCAHFGFIHRLSTGNARVLPHFSRTCTQHTRNAHTAHAHKRSLPSDVFLFFQSSSTRFTTTPASVPTTPIQATI